MAAILKWPPTRAKRNQCEGLLKESLLSLWFICLFPKELGLLSRRILAAPKGAIWSNAITRLIQNLIPKAAIGAHTDWLIYLSNSLPLHAMTMLSILIHKTLLAFKCYSNEYTPDQKYERFTLLKIFKAIFFTEPKLSYKGELPVGKFALKFWTKIKCKTHFIFSGNFIH